MSVLARYVLREFFRLLIICQGIFLSIYLMIDFTGGIDDFLKAETGWALMFAYYGYKIPAIAVQMLPVASLTAVIILFCMMKKNNEITALNGCGASLFQVAGPLLLASFALSTGLFVFSEMVVPVTSSRSNDIWRVEVKDQAPGGLLGQSHIWYRGQECVYWIEHYDAQKQVMMELTIYFFDDSFRLLRRIDGRRGFWTGDGWEIRQGILQEALGGGGYDMRRFDVLTLNLPEMPKDFVREALQPEEMGYQQLKRFARRLQSEGYDATRYFVDLHIKVAFPFILVSMVLIGVPIAVWKKTMGAPVAVTLGIVLCFMYLLVFGLSRTLGLAGILPPLLSAWVANGAFFFLGIHLMRRVEAV